ncbi:cell shape-determining protein MreC [Clostridia bacterium]|nr:cell shape-determining protein MreC [Clostridia bacterium]
MLTIVSISLNLSGHGNIVSDVVVIVTSPFNKFADLISASVSGFAAYFTEFNNLKDENAELKDRLAALENDIEEARILRETNDSLMAFYELKREHMDFNLEHAQIIARESGNYLSQITINKGTFHSVSVDMPVISKDGIVGFISEAGIMTSKVTLFLRTGAAIPAIVRRTGQTGMIVGSFSLERDGLCKITYLPKDADIAAGDTILSSGHGSIYPEQLIIGEVTEVIPDSLTQSMIGYVKPVVDFNELRDVMIIKGFERSFY